MITSLKDGEGGGVTAYRYGASVRFATHQRGTWRFSLELGRGNMEVAGRQWYPTSSKARYPESTSNPPMTCFFVGVLSCFLQCLRLAVVGGGVLVSSIAGALLSASRLGE